MFIQIIQGHVTDPAAVKESFDRWHSDLAPGADGWLGTTAGVADDGTFFSAACFASVQQARHNSERPEQHQWWMETAKYFSGEAVFHDCMRVETFPQGSPGFSSRAGFVQVIQGRVQDPDRACALMRSLEAEMGQWRPDVLGMVLALHPAEDAYTELAYFTSEQEARRNEGKETPPSAREFMSQLQALEVGEPTYLDLREPWVSEPGG